MTLQTAPTNTYLEIYNHETVDIHPLLRKRASVGSFSSTAITRQEIHQLLEAARCAPSSYNTQPWHFVVVRDGPGRDEINSDLIAWGAPWASKAPVLLAVLIPTSQGTRLHGLNYALFDCGLAVENLLLQASSMNLAAHPVGFKDRCAVEQALHLTEAHRLLLFIALGHTDGSTTTTNASRLRKPLSAIATWDCWDGPSAIEQASALPVSFEI